MEAIKTTEQSDETSAVSAPAAFLPFAKHEDALNVLEELGYKDARVNTPFTSAELVQDTNALLHDRDITLMDMTTTIPNTPQAAYNALTIAGFNAAASCKKDNNAAFVIMRTEANTPSFLIGHHWSMTQILGREAANAHIRNSPTPAVFVMFKEQHFYLPSSVCKTNVCIASRLVARQITTDDSFFCCCICNLTFVEDNNTACVSVSELGMAPCKHMFHRACAMQHVMSPGDRGCPACKK